MRAVRWYISLGFLAALAAVGTAYAAGTLDDGPLPLRDGASISPPSSEPASEPAPSPEPQLPAGGQPRSAQPPAGGVFRILSNDPVTLDPHLTGDTTSALVVVDVFSGLVALDTNLQVVPEIAQSWDISTSTEGTVYTFHLRPGVTFHNGVPVTSTAFKWSMERAAATTTASAVAGIYLLDDIVGFSEYRAGTSTEMTGIQTIDDLTLQITIDAPKPYFLMKLTFPAAYVLDQQTVEAGGSNWWVTNPVGTGPFKLTEYLPGDRIVLQRNEGNYLGPPNLDGVYMDLSGGQAITKYESGDIHFVEVGQSDLGRVLDPTDPLNRDLLIAPPGFLVEYLGFNVTMPPFDDLKFRQALNHAVDKELIATAVFGGLKVPAYGVLPPGFPGFTSTLPGLRHDTSTAIQLLNESAYAVSSTRPSIVLTVPGTGGTVGLDLEVILEMWRVVLGVDAAIQQVEFATFLGGLFSQQYQAYSIGFQADYPDPQNFLDTLFHTGGGFNHSAYSNAQVDQLLESARVEQDAVTRIDHYRQAEQLIVNDAVWVPLWHPGDRHVLLKPHEKGYSVTPLIVPKLRHVYIDPAVTASVPGVSLWGLLGLASLLAVLLLLRLRKDDYRSAAGPAESAHAPRAM